MPSKWCFKRKQAEDPDGYAAHVQTEKERSKRRREDRKARSEQQERDRDLSRIRSRRYRKKAGNATTKRGTKRSAEAAQVAPGDSARPRDMTEEERRQHRNQQRAASRRNEHPHKTWWRKKRERESRQMNRKQEKEQKYEKRSSLPKTPLKKTDYNFLSSFRQKLIKKTKTPQQFARMVANMVKHTRSPRRKQALTDEGMSFESRKAPTVNVSLRRRLETKRKPRKDKLQKKQQQKVKLFYLREDVSRVLPHKRYATKHGAGYVMQQTLLSAFKIFKSENPDFKIGYTLFTKLRPRNVRQITSTFGETCACVYCTNIQLKIISLNRTASQANCQHLRLEGEKALCKMLLCDKGNALFHKPSCIHGSCSDCADRRHTLFHHFHTLPSDLSVTWTRWTRTTAQGKTKRQPVVRKATVQDLLEELVLDIEKPTASYTFIEHLHTAHWQHHQYRTLKDQLKENQILLVMDFAENRTSMCQDEIKSAHFSKKQITLHPIVAFYRDRTAPDGHGDLVRHAMDFVSDDIIHDHNAVHHFTQEAFKFLQKEGILRQDSDVIIFSDGCASQYKGRGTFADLSHYPFKVQRVYFGSEHGKGEADGETGAISKNVETAVLCRKTFIESAADLYDWCHQNLTKDSCLSKRNFFLVQPSAIQRKRQQTAIKPVKGCRKLHEVVRIAPSTIKARNLACFCEPCQQNLFSHCLNKDRTGHFQVYALQSEAQEIDLGISGTDTNEPYGHDLTDNEPVQLPRDISDNCDETRAEFFRDYQARLLHAKSRNFDSFRACAASFAREVEKFPLAFPDSEPQFDRDMEDCIAEGLRAHTPETVGRFACRTGADGNCLPRALSLAVFGTDTFHQELRVRISCEMALNKEHYMSPDVISRGTHLNGATSADVFHQTGDFIEAIPEIAFEFEAMVSASNSKDMGPWQLLAAANILQRQIHSVFPSVGSPVLCKELHRPFLPRVENAKMPDIFILWSSNRDDLEHINPSLWTPNHFVPIVKQRGVDEFNTAFCEPSLPTVGEFICLTYTIGRREVTHRALVSGPPAGVVLREREFYVQFMRPRGQYFVFPRISEYSVVSVDEARVHICPQPTINKRNQYLFK